MALLGMGANVERTGYLPGYYSTSDLMFGAEGSTWTSSNGNGELKSDCYHNGSLPASSPAQFLGYNRELLKQTILKHEAIFRNQIHDLHRLYQKQRELMDELKRNELNKHNLRLETSWSSSTLSHVSSKIDPRICCSPSLPWLTGQSSVLMAESIQFPLGIVQENNKQSCLAPVPTEGCAKDPGLSESKYRKVGKKILDLQLPADEYIDGEGESLEDEGVRKMPKVSAYTLNGISQLVYTDRPSLGSNGANSNGYVDLNALFKLEGKATTKSDDFVGYTCLRNIPSYDLSSSTKLGSHNFSNDFILNPKGRQNIDTRSDDPPLEQQKKHGRSFHTDNAGKNGTEQLSVSSEIFSKKPEQPSFLNQINQGAWSGRKFSGGESSVAAQGSTIDGLVGPSSALRTGSPYQLVSMDDITSSGISPSVLREGPTGDFCQRPMAVQAFPSFGISSPLGQSSISFRGMAGFPGSELYHCKSIKSGPNLDRSNFLLSSFCGGPKTSDPPLISTNDLNSPENHGASHDLMKYAKSSEDVGTPKNLNLNIMPSGCSDIGALQSNQVTDKDNKFQDLERRLPWFKEKRALKRKPTEENKNSSHIEPVLSQPYNLDGLNGFELKKVGDGDLSRGKILVHHINGQPLTSLDLHSSHASPSKISKTWSENQKAGKIEESCVSDVEVPCNDLNELAEQAPVGEHIMKNELEKKHKGLAGHIDLNLCLNEDENTPIDIDLQAPVSPENKECSPPRGESDENQLEMPCRLVGKDDPEALEEQVKIAAGSLVSISASVAYKGHQMSSLPPSESFASDSLHWFSGIVSSVMDYLENGVKVDFSCNPHDLEELLPAGFDYFEAMTLKLNETKVLDCCCKSIGQMEEEGGSTSSIQPRKGRLNRGRQRKDFQSEILPSLASLSRYEVTEDLQTIGGLIEAAGTQLETSSLRNAGRNVLARGRKRSFTSSSDFSDLLLKQLTGNTEPGFEKRGLMSWGKINRKPRGRRYPARNPQFILSQANN
ncbi:hypothetical protein L6164_011212 [Bauhinia variegata]|uniref:Uncharacterized protein n=1 Tax=Bauhinia variegata TaxID=167791 RepID=A0ACB9P5X0_BAUVA|nr:hypothetical protein L6164_011212 [Bauhinia variegata]